MSQGTLKTDWLEANMAYLAEEFARLRHQLEATQQQPGPRAAQPATPHFPFEAPPAIDQLAEVFGLSPFERDVLLLCASVEMDSKLAAQCGEAQGHAQQTYVTFAVAMAALDDPHWSAVTPARPLRHFRLIEMDGGRSLASAPLRIDERILHYIAGMNLLDPRLSSLLRPRRTSDCLAETHRALAKDAAEILQSHTSYLPILHFCGNDPQGQEDTAGLASDIVGRQLLSLQAPELPPPGAELEQFALLWQRESVLLPAALLLQCGMAGMTPSARHLLERLPGLIFVSSREPLQLERPFLRFDVNKPAPAEQKRLWQRALGTAAANLNGTLNAVSEQFRLSARTIASTAALIAPDGAELERGALWNACRAVARPRLEDLAQRIVPSTGWDDLVLPEQQRKMLRQVAAQVRHRMTVHETWGFSAKGRRGLGVSALFCGEPGTGKTMAAEVLACELALDLYRIDLSAVVSKYIGETEKNLKQVFDAAEEGGVLLLFDEADALFGKRGEVKDSHDRYANIEVGYLLQRMEAYQGLAILTTNMKSSLDRAFQRRLRYTVNFPFPDAAQREAIWSKVFPPEAPREALDFRKLSQLNMAGGNIRNIALNAAFMAAEVGKPIRMSDLAEAAKLEAQKIERPLASAEIRGVVMSRIRLTIDRLVLKGLQTGEGNAVAETLRAQLTSAMAERAQRGDWPGPHRTPVLKLGRMPLEAGQAGARKFGAQLARAVSKGLKP